MSQIFEDFSGDNLMERKVTISKLDAARQQMETAVRLYFSHGDPISIHTLVAASYNVLRDLNKKCGGVGLVVKEQFLEAVKDECQKEMQARLNAAENFFKHADRDADSSFDFNPDVTELLLFEACSVYFRLSREYPLPLRLFQWWFMANNQDLFNLPDDQRGVFAALGPDIVEFGRERYFNDALLLMARKGT